MSNQIMSTQPEDQFTLLYEDGKRKVLHEFQCITTDDIIDEMIQFLRGVGHLEINIIERMNEISKQYLELYHSNKEMFLELQQDELNDVE
jgi:hypothetical protein